MNAFDYSKNGALKLLKIGKGVRALKYFTEALQYKPLNVDCLVSRSHCYLYDGHIDKAEIDANLAYKTEPNNPKAIYQKAEVHFFKGEFETALLYYHQGHALRPDDNFRVGIQRAETGVRNCVGDKNLYPINASTVTAPLEKSKSSFSKLNSQEVIVTNKPIKTSRTIKELLKEVSNDRTFMEKLIKDEEIRITKLKDIKTILFKKRKLRVVRNCFCNFFYNGDQKDFNSKRIKAAALHCMNYLEPRIEFWQQHKPFYTRIKNKKQKRITDSTEKDRSNWTIHNVLLELVHIEMLEYQGDFLKVVDRAKKVVSILKDIQGIGKHKIYTILSDLFSIIGNCYMKLGLYTEALEYHELDRQNGIAHTIKDAISRSMDYIGIIYFAKQDYQNAIKTWTAKIKLAVSHLELAWLYHEIGRCYHALNDFENSLKYASFSLEKANLGMDENWQMNANILIAKTYFSLNRSLESTEYYMRALELSKIMKLNGVEEELNKLIQENLVKPRLNDISRLQESIRNTSKTYNSKSSLESDKKLDSNDNSDTETESNSGSPVLRLNIDENKLKDN